MFVETKEHGEAQEAPAKVLKLSEAIRAGIHLYPVQCAKDYYRDGAACVWGAAAAALRMSASLLHGSTMFIEAENAFTSAHGRSVMDANDDGMSRESIADWLEAQGY